MTGQAVFEPGTLWRAVVERTDHAQRCGALAPIETRQQRIDDCGVRFLVRCVSTLARKAKERPKQPARNLQTGENAKHFPVESELVVADVSDLHVAVLNKFPVIPHHVLLVTRDYVPQQALLDAADFRALAACLHEYDCLGFYNGGEEAGASQPHKHLQLVPLPLADDRAIPMEALFEPAHGRDGIVTVPALSFPHALAWQAFSGPHAADVLLRTYRALLDAVGIHATMEDGVVCQSAPYNLLVTLQWMLVVARSREHFEGISINALGFAGSIFVKNDAELARVREAGPMSVLRSVTTDRAE